MAYRTARRKSSLLTRRGNVSNNSASANVVAGDGSAVFNPSVSLGDVKEVTSKDYVVAYDSEGNSMGEPMKIASFAGWNVYDKSVTGQEAKFVGICNKGNTTLEIMLKVRNYVTQGKILTGVTATAADG